MTLDPWPSLRHFPWQTQHSPEPSHPPWDNSPDSVVCGCMATNSTGKSLNLWITCHCLNWLSSTTILYGDPCLVIFVLLLRRMPTSLPPWLQIVWTWTLSDVTIPPAVQSVCKPNKYSLRNC
jgi:hypothetical protein